MLVYNNPNAPFRINILVARVRFCYYIIHNYFRYATLNTMTVDRKSEVAFVIMTRKRNTCINEIIFKKLAFYEDFTAKVYEEHSPNCPGYTFRQ